MSKTNNKGLKFFETSIYKIESTSEILGNIYHQEYITGESSQLTQILPSLLRFAIYWEKFMYFYIELLERFQWYRVEQMYCLLNCSQLIQEKKLFI